GSATLTTVMSSSNMNVARQTASRLHHLRSVRNRPRIAEVDHAADSVLSLHQLEASVDLVERERVGDEGIDVDVSVEIALNKLWHLVAALDAAERRAAHEAAGG